MYPWGLEHHLQSSPPPSVKMDSDGFIIDTPALSPTAKCATTDGQSYPLYRNPYTVDEAFFSYLQELLWSLMYGKIILSPCWKWYVSSGRTDPHCIHLLPQHCNPSVSRRDRTHKKPAENARILICILVCVIFQRSCRGESYVTNHSDIKIGTQRTMLNEHCLSTTANLI